MLHTPSLLQQQLHTNQEGMSLGAKYYDLHDILAGETAIPCTLQTHVNSCGKLLDQSSEHDNLKNGHSLDIPLWLANDVAARNMVTVR